MAAYAALASLMNLMVQVQDHPRHSTSFNKKQIISLKRKVGFLLDFMESNNSHTDRKVSEDLESQIASAAHTAEDEIESYIVDQIYAGSNGGGFFDLQKVLLNIGSITNKIVKTERNGEFRDKQPAFSSPVSSLRPLTTGKNIMVGFDAELVKLKDWLTGAQSNRQVIPIVGMGGIGKTTLARNVYESPLVVHYFDSCAWVTISQKYSVRDILLELLLCEKNTENQIDVTNGKSQNTEEELGRQLYKGLCGRRYLIVLDDIWSIEAWDEIKFFFPDTNNGSRIVITTRLSNLAVHFGSWSLKMSFLDENPSWKLFCEKTFVDESFPLELVDIGKKIVLKCRGLPLSIVAIGGLLRKCPRTREYWTSFAKDINSILNSREYELCLNILFLSYSHLPPHLKPCFLYMGIFPEDEEIYASRLIKLWVAEGFLRPSRTQSLEEVARGCLIDLIDRNLLLVRKWGMNGKVKTCNIHDLLRDLCLRVAEKEKFLCVMRACNIPRGIDTERRIVFHYRNPTKSILALPFTSLVRSLICTDPGELSFNFRLLRVFNMPICAYLAHPSNSDSLASIFNQINLKYLSYHHHWISNFMLPSSISLLWNLQMLILRGNVNRIKAPCEIWELPQLRHVEFDNIALPDPLQNYHIVLRNLQTLKKAANFRLSEEVCKRIPNIKKLHISYDDFLARSHDYCLYNSGSLQYIESFNLVFGNLPDRDDLLQNLTFPSSLKKLSLTKSQLHWEDMTMIGSLPHLEVLKLELGSVTGTEWNPVEDQFLRLKYLKIHYSDLMFWNVESSHFPVLESLVLDQMLKLDEIPLSIGEIPTLKVIRLDYCKRSAADSAMKILEEQESLGNEGLQVRVQFWKN